jgi:ferrous iron transport protein B
MLLKRTLLRGETPVFVMEMPLYKVPSPRLVIRRALDAGMMFLRRAATFILATMILIWFLLYFPAGEYPSQVERLEHQIDIARSAVNQPVAGLEEQLKVVHQQWKAQSYLGRAGRLIEPVVAPLGWDWRIGMAALASFPAREVMVGTLGIVFSHGAGEAGDETYRSELGERLRDMTWDNDPTRQLFTFPVALSIMVFFALCCQCVSTLAVIRRETNSWRWPAFTFVYMTVLAYLGALLTYQLGRWLS